MLTCHPTLIKFSSFETRIEAELYSLGSTYTFQTFMFALAPENDAISFVGVTSAHELCK